MRWEITKHAILVIKMNTKTTEPANLNYWKRTTAFSLAGTVHWEYLRWQVLYLDSTFVGRYCTLTVPSLAGTIPWEYLRWQVLHLHSNFVGKYCTLAVPSMATTEPWLYLDCTLTVPSMAGTVPWQYLRWQLFYLDSTFDGRLEGTEKLKIHVACPGRKFARKFKLIKNSIKLCSGVIFTRNVIPTVFNPRLLYIFPYKVATYQSRDKNYYRRWKIWTSTGAERIAEPGAYCANCCRCLCWSKSNNDHLMRYNGCLTCTPRNKMRAESLLQRDGNSVQ